MSTDSSTTVVVIGGGMAGLMAAIAAARTCRVVLLEKKSLLGCKVRLSGSGQCNVTHCIDPHSHCIGQNEFDRRDVEAFLTRYGPRGRFVKHALSTWTPCATMRFFEERGCPLVVEESGKVFPASRKALSIVTTLEEACRRGGVEIVCGDPVVALETIPSIESHGASNTARLRVVARSGTTWDATSVVLATGGRSFPQTGSSGDGYRFAAALGHTIVLPRVALTPVVVRNWSFSDASGIALRDLAGDIVRNGRKVRSFVGDVLFTHRGLSGPAILDASRFLIAGDTIRLNLLDHAGGRRRDAESSQTSEEETQRTILLCGDIAGAEKAMRTAFSIAGGKSVRRAMAVFGVPDAILVAIFARESIPLDLKVAVCDVAARRTLARSLVALECVVESLGDWNEAMATTGGVETREVYPKTLASRLVAGLAFAGELLDVDGDCGGFNLQWAMSSGFVAGGHLQ